MSAFSSILVASSASPEIRPGTFWMPPIYSNWYDQVDWPFYFITWICIVFFVLIVGLMGWFMWKYRRMSPTQKADHEAPTHNTPLEVTWSAIPLVLVIAMFYVGFEGYMDMFTPPENTYDIEVIAQKWDFQFSYENGRGYSPELHVPPDRPVRLIMRSQDVIHALFVPDLRVKQDIVPGKLSVLWFVTPNDDAEPRHHQIFCAEYCGRDHSRMLADMYVHPSWESFQTKLEEIFDPYRDRKLWQVGEFFYNTRGCKTCHSIDGSVNTGPTFQGLWTKLKNGEEVFEDGTRLDQAMVASEYNGVVENYLFESIRQPQRRIVNGYARVMPVTAGLRDDDVYALIAYLKYLDEGETEETGRMREDDAAEDGGDGADEAGGAGDGSNE